MSTNLRRQALNPTRVRAARAHLFTNLGETLMDEVRVVLCEPLRTQIVQALHAGPLTVSELVASTGRGRTAVSQHLRVLRQEHLVEPDRRGRMMYYQLTSGRAADSAVRLLAIVAELAV